MAPHSALPILHSAFRIPHYALRIPHFLPNSALRILHSALLIPHHFFLLAGTDLRKASNVSAGNARQHIAITPIVAAGLAIHLKMA